MADSLGYFVELDEPVDMGSFGWYIGCQDISDDYYLHDDGIAYNSCAPRYDALPPCKRISTGWYADGISAHMHANKYYNKYGLKYPYEAVAADANNIESQIMEFE